jgi:PAS domain-containing protein
LATQALQAGIWDWDVRTNLILWDEKMYEIYGIPKNLSVNYQMWADAVVSEDLPGTVAVLQSVMASNSQGSAEFRITLPDGSLRDDSDRTCTAGIGAPGAISFFERS